MLPTQRHLFDIPSDVAYLNCAYMSPLMKSSLDAGIAGLTRKAHPWELTSEKFFTGAEEFRSAAAPLLEASPDDIAIVPSAGFGIATAARNLPIHKGQSILVLAEQFPSNYYSWQRKVEETGASLKVVPWPENQDWTAAVLDSLTPRSSHRRSPSRPMDERRPPRSRPHRRSLPQTGNRPRSRPDPVSRRAAL